jgi:hypothetical protein
MSFHPTFPQVPENFSYGRPLGPSGQPQSLTACRAIGKQSGGHAEAFGLGFTLRASLRRWLEEVQPSRMDLKDVPDARVRDARHTLAWLAGTHRREIVAVGRKRDWHRP